MNLDVLGFVVENGAERFDQLIEEAGLDEEAAHGIATKILADKGEIDNLSKKQHYYYQKCIAPLFKVGCDGVFGIINERGDDSCDGNGWVDDEALLESYIDGEFMCSECRWRREKLAAE